MKLLEVTDLDDTVIVKDDGKEIIFDIIPKPYKRDIYPHLVQRGCTVRGRKYRCTGFSRIDSPGKCRYWIEKIYTPLKIIAFPPQSSNIRRRTMNISPFSNEPLTDIADQLGWADKEVVNDNLVSVCIVLCKRVEDLEYKIKKMEKLISPASQEKE
jgi:hypothetical protein